LSKQLKYAEPMTRRCVQNVDIFCAGKDLICPPLS